MGSELAVETSPSPHREPGHLSPDAPCVAGQSGNVNPEQGRIAVMPFKSDKQRRWMYANKPAMAKRWSKEEKAGRGKSSVKGSRRRSGKRGG